MTLASSDIADRRATFRQLHEAGCFVMPNPWDRGSACWLVELGFPAIASTSSGFAWSRGMRDNTAPLAQVLAHLRDLASAVTVPVNADFEGGFAVSPEGVAVNFRAAATTGIAGISIEDSTGNAAAPLYARDLSIERVRAAREAIDASGTGVLLTARSEGFIVDRPDLEETLRRLTAYAEAGADCLYAPGIRDRADIMDVVKAVAPKPVNVLVGSDFTTLSDLAELGVRRISVGGALARVAWTSFLRATREIAEHGTFSAFGGLVQSRDLEKAFIDGPRSER